MIAKGNLHASGGKLAAYLTTGKDGERAELKELRGFAADNIRDAFTDVEIQAEATRSTKPFFHAYIRLPHGEALAHDQWQRVADKFEKGLGFEGQGRAVAFHHKADGATHMHIAWSRIDLETMRSIDPGLYKNKLKEMSRELERELGITVVRNERDPEQKTRAAGRNEFEQSRRLDTNLREIRETIRACWDRSDSGRAFAAALGQEGMILARGDRRDFVIVDRQGGQHALGKRITGTTAAETRARMSDIDRAALPSVDQARERQADRQRSEGIASKPALQRDTRPAPEPRGSQPEIAQGPRLGPGGDSGAKVLDGVARAAVSLLDSVANMFSAPTAEKPVADRPPAERPTAEKGREPQAVSTPDPAKEAPQPAAHVREEQARSERRQELLRQYSQDIPPERQNDPDIGRTREREW